MKRTIRNGLAAALVFAALGAPARAELPAFMHVQGVLTDDLGLPVNDTVSMSFSIYADTSVSAIYGDTQPAVPVVNGFYEAYLDVSVLDFDVPYYLGIVVEGAPLGPKKPLASVPYSIRSAKTRVIAGDGLVGSGDSSVVSLSLEDGGITASKLGDGAVMGQKIADGAVSHAKLGDGAVWTVNIDNGQVTTEKLADSSVTSAKIAHGAVVRSLNGKTDDLSLLAGSNVTITPGDGTLTISSVASGAGADDDWVVNGNNVYSQQSGNVGIGTAAPAYKLDVDGDVYASGKLRAGAPNGTAPLSVASSTVVTNLNADMLDGIHAGGFSQPGHAHDGSSITTGTVPFARLPVGDLANTVAAGAHGHDASAINNGTLDFARLPTGTGGSQVAIGNHSHVFGDDGDWTILGNDIYSTVIGNVGIGTTTPARKLDVNGTMGVDGGLFARDATGIGLADQGGNLGVWVEDGGEVGIGFSSPATTMHVYEGTGSAELRVETPVAAAHAAITLKSDGSTYNRLEIEHNSASTASSTAGIPLANVSRISTGTAAGPLLLQVMTDTCMYFVTNQTERMRITGDGLVRVWDDLWVGSASPSDTDRVYFDNGGEHVSWDDGQGRFELSDDFAIGGTIAAGGSTIPLGSELGYNIFSASSSPSPVSGDMSTSGDVYVYFDLEVGSDIYYSGTLTDLSPAPPFKDGRVPEEVGFDRAMAALASLRPRVVPVAEEEEGKTFVETTKLGFLVSELPDMVKNEQGNGYRPFDIVAILTKVVQEQQKTIDARDAKLADLEARLLALEQKTR
ncbi:MAG: hypothetical protein ABIK65_09640 [Candidatus Eisenbacteria bacterium]